MRGRTLCALFFRELLFAALTPSQAAKYPGVPIYGGSDKVPELTNLVKDKDEFAVGNAIHIKL